MEIMMATTKKVTKAVFPVAGLGTRFLPATKANPKEMLPIVDKPLIQYAVEEAIKAGIEELIFVTSSTKRAIEDHFDSNFELETKLAQNGKQELLDIVKSILPKGVSCAYVRQPETLGLGHAVLCARPLIFDEPFAVLLADDLIDAVPGCLAQMVALYEKHRATIVAVQEIPREETNRYGVVSIKQDYQIKGLVEKPAPELAPSTLGVVGRYILSPSIFRCLETTSQGSGGEIQLTDGIAKLLETESAYAYAFQGKRYDCGSKMGYLEATIAHALKHPELSETFRQYLKTII
jgi:UTP--glucose-1-phosphate uridylyltransferase